MDKGQEIILSALYLLDEIWGRTYLQKFLFLLNSEIYNGNIFEFRKYKYGPFCDTINNAVTELNEKHIIKENPVLTKGLETGYKYSLTNRGKKIANDIFENKLSPNEREKLIEYTNRFRRYSPTELLKYVYQKYPGYIENNVFQRV